MARALRIGAGDMNHMPMQPATSRSPTLAALGGDTEFDNWLRRIRAEYWEMPGLALSIPQAQRLWSLDGSTVERLFAQLVAAGELRQLADRRFVRARNDR
jgi:hypothetical protein